MSMWRTSVMLVCLAWCLPSIVTATQKSHTHAKHPPRKQLQEDLGNKIREASDRMQKTLQAYSHKLYNVSCVADAQRIGQYIDRICCDLRTIMEYFEQLATGDPALSRDALAHRIQDVERMITTWNNSNLE